MQNEKRHHRYMIHDTWYIMIHDTCPSVLASVTASLRYVVGVWIDSWSGWSLVVGVCAMDLSEFVCAE
jgi:hypothetical protein